MWNNGKRDEYTCIMGKWISRMIVTVLVENKNVNRKTAANQMDSNQNNAFSGW